MKLALTAGLVLALSAPLYADSKPAAPKGTKDQASYAIGTNIGRDLKSSELDVNAAMLAQGIQDAFAGKSALSDEEIKTALTTFQKEMEEKMEAKQKAAGEANKATATKFLEENKKKDGVKTTKSGIQYKVVTEGKGAKPKASDTVKVHYAGKLINGTEFDSSYKRGEPVEFPLEGVIPGWTEIVQLMPVGSKWEVVIPAELAYGDRGQPPVIGPNETLLFEIELLDIPKADAGDAKAEEKK